MTMKNHVVINKNEISILIKKIRNERKKIIFTNGCFDILHVGHVKFLEKAKSLGDVLIVGINNDSSVSRLKGLGRPLINDQERSKIVASLNSVDYVIVFNEDTPTELISQIKPDIHVKGGDYEIDNLPERSEVLKYGGKIEILPLYEGKSTTNLIKKIRDDFRNEK